MVFRFAGHQRHGFVPELRIRPGPLTFFLPPPPYPQRGLNQPQRRRWRHSHVGNPMVGAPAPYWTQWRLIGTTMNNHIWLVVYLLLWKIWKSIGMMNPNIWENKNCSKPPTRYDLSYFEGWCQLRSVFFLLCFTHDIWDGEIKKNRRLQ